MGSRRTSRAPGTAAAGEGCASSGTAARTTTGGSTATPRFTATATAAARSSASPTTRPTSHADRAAELSQVAALLIGLTGAWSPCGFSMVETIGLSGDGARRRTTIASCATFAPGAVVGGIATFGLLSAAGRARSRRRRTSSPTWSPRRSRSPRRWPRRGARGSCRRSGASFPSAGGGRCRCRSRRRSTGSCSGSGSPPSCSASASGRWPGSALALGDPPRAW